MFNWKNLLHNVFPFHHSAWKATVQPISALLNETNEIHQDELTVKWYKNMLSHLQVVLIASSLISTIVTSSLTWPTFTGPNDSLLKATRAIMLGSLILSIFSIATASQQIVALQRLHSYEHGPRLIRKLLSVFHKPNGTEPKPIELPVILGYHWQIPVMLQGQSLYLFLLGMGLFAYHEFGIILGFFLGFLLFGLGNYLICTLGLWRWVDFAISNENSSPPSEGEQDTEGV